MSKKYRTLLLIVIVTSIVYLLPAPAGLERPGNLGLTVMVFAGGLWVLEPIPLQVTGLIIPVSLVATGLLDVRAAFAPFSSPVVFLILGSLFLAESLRKHGLTRRLALDLIVRCEGNPKLLLLAIMIVASVTSMWIFSTAVVAMLIPVCLAIASRVDEEHRSRFITVLLMALVFSSTLGAMSTILGASSNAVASGVLGRIGSWTFTDWMKYGTPLAFIYVPLTWFVIVITVYPDIDPISVDSIVDELHKYGDLSRAEKGILYILGGAIILWVFGPSIGSYLGLPADLMHSSIISLCAAALLFGTDIITWQDARQVNWGIYLIIGAGLALGKGLHTSGVSDWFAHFMSGIVTDTPYPVIAGFLVGVTALASNTVNNTTVVAILAPVMSDAATTMGLTPRQLMLPMAFGATFGFIVPAASSRMALIYASGEVDPADMLRIGGLVTVPLLIMTTMYFSLLFQLGWL